MKLRFYLLFSIILLLNAQAFCLPVLNSLSSAKATIFLDFDGQFIDGTSWNNGTPFYAAPSGFNDKQIEEIFHRVAEDYRPFNINITTDSSTFFLAPFNQRVRIVVTTTSSWYANVGGVSYTGSFTWGDDTPGFVFVDKLAYSTKNVAECCTHESGHTLGLSHQAKYNGSCTLIATYNDGVGSGEIGWAPVMGNSYGKNLSGWNNGPTPNGCTADQDNLSIITSRNGFSYRPDDFGDLPSFDMASIGVSAQDSINGIISTNTDKDIFKLVVSAKGTMRLQCNPFSVGPQNQGANLDIKVSLLNSSFEVVKAFDPENILNVEIDTFLNAGTYFIMVEGAGNINASNYGSLGSYTLKTLLTPVAVAIKSQVLLSGKVENGMHRLQWNIVLEDKVENVILENSLNGTIFNPQTSFSSETGESVFVPISSGNISYRLKIITKKGDIFYSNIVNLDSPLQLNNSITVTTLVESDIKINAAENYKYLVADISGRVVKSGTGNSGKNNININNCPNGIYFLQIISNSQRTTKRIVKL
jgi:hypothetical protein